MNNHTNFPPLYKTIIRKCNGSNLVIRKFVETKTINGEETEVEVEREVLDNWLGDEEMNEVIRIAKKLEGRTIISIMKKFGCIYPQETKMNLSEVPNSHPIVLDTMALEVFISRTAQGLSLDPSEQALKELDKKKEIVDLSEENDSNNNNNNIVSSEPKKKKQRKECEKFHFESLYNPRHEFFWASSYSKEQLTEAKFNKFMILQHLDLPMDLDWQKNTSVLLIPVHGPYTSLQCKEGYAAELTRNHWSLLCYYPPENTIFHYDSLGYSSNGSNKYRAREIIRILKMFRVIPHDTCEEYDPENIPRQTYGYECGQYVIYWILMILAKTPARPLSQKDFGVRYKGMEDITKSGAFTSLVNGILMEELFCKDFFD